METEPAKWWLSEPRTDRAFPGAIEIDSAGNVSIHVYERLPGLEDIPFFDPTALLPSFPIIYGLTMSDHWTLLDCQIESWRNNFAYNLCDIVLRPRVALAGEFLLNSDELSVTQFCFSLWDQDDWAAWARTLEVTDRDDAVAQNLTVTHVPPNRRTAALGRCGAVASRQ
ncbi:ApeA N-terminal domain 1-containing protein [Microlunatus ginsengisoli]|uniref:ApeA N-terminal domain-containing protein n=1 Tax=Microlunatus ginsengisoli TaxID=363863 RepID=A0ABP6ZPP2_9ACTN